MHSSPAQGDSSDCSVFEQRMITRRCIFLFIPGTGFAQLQEAAKMLYLLSYEDF